MPKSKPVKKKRFNKRLYVYMAFVTMAAVHLLARPIQKGWTGLHHRLKEASQKRSLRTQLALNQSQSDLWTSSAHTRISPKER